MTFDFIVMALGGIIFLQGGALIWLAYKLAEERTKRHFLEEEARKRGWGY